MLPEFDKLGLGSRSPVSLGGVCAVLAETETVSLLSAESRREHIIAGLHRAVTKRLPPSSP